MSVFEITPGAINIEDLKSIWQQHQKISLNKKYHDAIHASAAVIAEITEQDETVYGINTGFGKLADVKIEKDQLLQLQRRIILSHAAGVGELLQPETVRLILLLKINALSQSYSGVRLEVIEYLMQFYNAQLYPCVPAKGSVGASGDLAPLAHLSLPLIGEGDVNYNGDIITGAQALEILNLPPLQLQAKEGLALLNGTQVSTALALEGLFKTERLFQSAITTGALTTDAVKASIHPFDDRIHQTRGHQGQIDVAKQLKELLNGSEILSSHEKCGHVQDPYSIRCQPQVMGACLDQIRHVKKILEIEANAVSDNPLIFTKEKDILSGGNFHAEPVAFCADILAMCIAEIGNISERRIALLMDESMSELPAFLVSDNGVNSGFMIAQVTAAALASENKQLAHPASVDTIPTSANQEDHVSMATHAARRLMVMLENLSGILGIELMAACQGIELRQPLKTSAKLQSTLKTVREKINFYHEDRLFATDLNQAMRLIERL